MWHFICHVGTNIEMQSKLYQAKRKHIEIVGENIIRNTRKINVFTSILINILMDCVMCVGTCIDLLWRIVLKIRTQKYYTLQYLWMIKINRN